MTLFDTTHATTTGVSDGQHIATIVGAEVRQNKAQTGAYINVKWQVEGGASFYQMYTIANQNQQAVNIGLADIGRFQVAGGKSKGPVEDLNEIIGIRCLITVKNETDDYGEKVKIKKYAPVPQNSGEDIPF
jgi:hypothetical protein